MSETVRGVWAKTMDFDPHDFLEGASAEHPLDTWLLANSDAWLSRTSLPYIDRYSAQRVFIVVGEAGSGKTTVLDVMRQDATGEGSFPIYFDFKRAPSLTGNFTWAEAEAALSTYLDNAIQLAVDEAGRWDTYRAALIRYVLRTKTSPGLHRVRVENPGIMEEGDNRRLLTISRAESEVVAYQAQHPEEFISLAAAQFVPAGPSRAVLLFDNLEGVSSLVRRVLFKKLSTLITARTLVFVGIRSENQHQAEALLQGRRDDAVVLTRQKQALLDIARTRNAGAQRACSQPFFDLRPDEVSAQYEAFETALAILDQDDYLGSLVMGWLNDDVRRYLTLFADMSARLATMEPKEAAGYVSQQLLLTRCHSSLLTVFDPQKVYTEKYKNHPFVFLPLRVLVYLENNGGSLDVAEISQDFNDAFGITEDRLRRALDRFTKKESGMPQVLRIEETDHGGERAHLLSCGEVFVKSVMFQCDYLSMLFDRIENPDDIPEVRSSSYYTEWKLRRSIQVVDKLIMPGFEAEHPYIRPKVKSTGSLRRRLSSYESMFSYKEGSWFVGRLRDSLQSYARRNQLESVARPVVGRLSAAEDRLNAVSRGAR